MSQHQAGFPLTACDSTAKLERGGGSTLMRQINGYYMYYLVLSLELGGTLSSAQDRGIIGKRATTSVVC